MISSCSHKTSIHKERFSGIQTEQRNSNNKDSYSRNYYHGLNAFRNRKSGRESFGAPLKRIHGSSEFDSKKRRVVPNNEKKGKDKNSFSRKTRQNKGSYAYDSKKKRVLKKKGSIFSNKNKKEKETSTFTGGHIKKNKNHKKNKSIRGMGKSKKKKGTREDELFNPGMGLKIKK